jgi:heterodisulfide reductase subunit C
MSTIVSPFLHEELRRLGDFDAEACMNCGICSAICPIGIDLLPRRLFRYAVLGLERRVREQSEAIFSCLLCRSCEENCPAGVHITENVRLLRRWVLGGPEGGR